MHLRKNKVTKERTCVICNNWTLEKCTSGQTCKEYYDCLKPNK